MSKNPEYGLPANDAEIERLAQIDNYCFMLPPEKGVELMNTMGRDTVRVLRGPSGVEAGLWLVPMGQFFGGRSVPMTGIAAVGVAPEARGHGAARRLMEHTVRELHDQGIPISTLYPATTALYRLVGYEPAGFRYEYELKPKMLTVKERGLSIRALTEADIPAVKEAQREYASRHNGCLDRGPYVWKRVFDFRGDRTSGFAVEEDGRIAGYVYYLQKPAQPFGYSLFITDLMALTPQAGRRLWSFLASHGSMSHEITWFGGPMDPLLTLLPEQVASIGSSIHWSVRILDAAKAIAARGFAPGLTLRVELDLTDSLLPANHGRKVLEIADGQGRLSEGGSGAVHVGINGLAPLYTGYHAAQGLRDAGLLSGPASELEKLNAAFAASAPWMREMF